MWRLRLCASIFLRLTCSRAQRKSWPHMAPLSRSKYTLLLHSDLLARTPPVTKAHVSTTLSRPKFERRMNHVVMSAQMCWITDIFPSKSTMAIFGWDSSPKHFFHRELPHRTVLSDRGPPPQMHSSVCRDTYDFPDSFCLLVGWEQ